MQSIPRVYDHVTRPDNVQSIPRVSDHVTRPDNVQSIPRVSDHVTKEHDYILKYLLLNDIKPLGM